MIGAGPIRIGQACEFDYSGVQGVQALREEGLRVVLVNSNPATIMTDPERADATYIEPITPEVVAAILEREKCDALLPTLGGQTALNIAVELAKAGVLDRLGIKLLGASVEAIRTAEDRELFREAMRRAGLPVLPSVTVTSSADADAAAEQVGFPAILRPSFTLGGTGAAVVYNRDEYRDAIRLALDASPVREVLVERSVEGWKEYELEVMRDWADTVVVVCSIENLDPMGVHTGDSITVAPALTLTDKEYQVLRDAATVCLRAVGVETGGANVQFAVNPATGEWVIIEMNPRVSRSSALASKATGFPIARIAAKLALGYRLDEIVNAITRSTPASFEPALDYVVVKIPRFAFEKFPGGGRRARHVDEVGRRGDGDRTDVRGGAPQGGPLARERPHRSGGAARHRRARRRGALRAARGAQLGPAVGGGRGAAARRRARAHRAAHALGPVVRAPHRRPGGGREGDRGGGTERRGDAGCRQAAGLRRRRHRAADPQARGRRPPRRVLPPARCAATARSTPAPGSSRRRRRTCTAASARSTRCPRRAGGRS